MPISHSNTHRHTHTDTHTDKHTEHTTHRDRDTDTHRHRHELTKILINYFRRRISHLLAKINSKWINVSLAIFSPQWYTSILYYGEFPKYSCTLQFWI